MAHRTRPAPDSLERSAQRAAPRRRTLAGALAAGAVAAVGLLATPAEAQTFGPGGCCIFADNSNHTYFYSNVTTANRSVNEWVRVNRIETTNMTTQVQLTSNNDTDVIVYDGFWDGVSWAAYWRCDALVTSDSSKCNRGRVVYNQSFGTAIRALACQENGHSLGLDHSASTDSCMHQNASVAADDFDTHDKGHINGYYL
jgi:hypothetical protein